MEFGLKRKKIERDETRKGKGGEEEGDKEGRREAKIK